MTVFYVGAGGSDASAGTSWGARWATIGKALGASGISSGDSVYLAPGIYREAVTVNMTAATVTTSIIGDTDGSHTSGLPGPVTWLGTQTDYLGAGTTFLTATSKNFLSFSNIVFEQSNGSGFGTWTTCTHITWTNCGFISNGTNAGTFGVTLTVDVDNAWLFDRCLITGYGSGNGGFLAPTCPTSTVADYTVGLTFQNCVYYGFTGPLIQAVTSGANSFKPGGIAIRGCTAIGAGVIQTSSATFSTTLPCTVKDCLIVSGAANAGIRANAAGQITEDYNLIIGSTPRTNVTAGVHSMSGSPGLVPRLSFGQETIWGGALRMMGTPEAGSPALGFGANSSPLTVDFLNRPRPGGTNLRFTSGTLTSGGTATATDTGATFGSDGQIVGATIKITGGTGSGQTMLIKSHTSTVITVYGSWNTQPDNTSTYAIYFGSPSFTGKATSGGAATLTQSNATWDTNLWAGFTVEITSGTGNGQTNTITSNTGTALTVPTWGTNPDSTSVYVIYRQTSVNTPLNAAGALERHDSAVKETTTTDAGGVAITITGPGDHQFQVPVDATSTTITVKVNYDTVAGTGTPPQAQLAAAPEIGYTGETITATSSTGTWLTLSFTPFTPTAKGIVNLRLIARAAAPSGRTTFDTVTVT